MNLLPLFIQVNDAKRLNINGTRQDKIQDFKTPFTKFSHRQKQLLKEKLEDV